MLKKHSGIYTLEAVQNLNTTIDSAWAFFSDPANLSLITPNYMGFEITSGETLKMYKGQIITYKIGIFPFIKTNWVTEITCVEDKKFFVDEQRIGPYKMWHHEHFFCEADSGGTMIDKVSFAIGFGFIGTLVYELIVEKKLKSIFAFRREQLNKIFG